MAVFRTIWSLISAPRVEWSCDEHLLLARMLLQLRASEQSLGGWGSWGLVLVCSVQGLDRLVSMALSHAISLWEQ